MQAPLMTDAIDVKDRVKRIRDRMHDACDRSGRSSQDVHLVAVSKTVGAERIREVFHAGVVNFAENRVHEAVDKQAELASLPINWHFVGTLQTNKAARASRMFSCIHSVDSVALGQKIDAALQGTDVQVPILVQMNLASEATKGGVDESNLTQVVEELSQLNHLQVRGLMQVPPFFVETEMVRPFFRRMRILSEEIAAARISNVSMELLSMGMSHDFEVAIEEGATLIRVGRAIFGDR